MESLLETIRVAIAPDATVEARAAGADACRMILVALAPGHGELHAPTVAAPPPLPIGQIVSALRGMPIEQLLDLAIARLRAVAPPDTTTTPRKPVKFSHVPVRGAKP